jgi:hypothetical protein
MKAASNEEILASWAKQRPGYKPGDKGDPSLDFWVKNRPDMLQTYAQNQLTGLLDRGILDPKTRYLLLVGLYMMNNHWDVLPQACNAKAAGHRQEYGSGLLCMLLGGKAKLQEAASAGHGFQQPHLPAIRPSRSRSRRPSESAQKHQSGPPSRGLALYARGLIRPLEHPLSLAEVSGISWIVSVFDDPALFESEDLDDRPTARCGDASACRIMVPVCEDPFDLAGLGYSVLSQVKRSPRSSAENCAGDSSSDVGLGGGVVLLVMMRS